MNIEQTKEKLRAILMGMEKCEDTGVLPEWASAIFNNSREIEIWVRPDAEDVPLIPQELDGVPIKTKIKGPGIAC